MIEFTDAEKALIKEYLMLMGFQYLTEMTILLLPIIIAQSPQSISDLTTWLSSKSTDLDTRINNIDAEKALQQSALESYKSDVDSLSAKLIGG